MEISEVIKLLWDNGHSFWPEGLGLRVVPKPSPEIVAIIKENKQAILEYCQRDDTHLVAEASFAVLQDALEAGTVDQDQLDRHEDANISGNIDRMRTETLKTYMRLQPRQRLAILGGKSFEEVQNV